MTLIALPGFFSNEQLRHVLEQSRPDVLLSDDTTRLAAFCDDSLAINLPLTDLCCHKTKTCSDEKTTGIDSAIAKITYTSGTTGQPKGVCLAEQAIAGIAFALSQALQDLPMSSHLSVLPFSTLLENVAGIYVPLLMGKTIIVLPSKALGLNGSSQLDVIRFVNTLNHYQPDSFILLPQLLMALLRSAQAGLSLNFKPRFIALGGAKTSPSLIEQAHAQGLPVYEGYGLSECASVVSLNTPAANKTGTVGQVLPHVEVAIRGGEIHVKGKVFSGYLHEANEAGEWLATGDLGFLDPDGFLTVLGRRRNVLISSFGRNINPEWLESELAKLSNVAQCVVFGDGRPFCTAVIALHQLAVPSMQKKSAAKNVSAEQQNQEWILNDIQACGYDKKAARNSTPVMSTEMMVAYAYDTIQRGNPLAFFGMVLVLEGTSVKLACHAADSIQTGLELPDKAFSYLRSHGNLDQEHMVFFEQLMNRIEEEKDQRDIIHAARMFYHLYGNIFRELDLLAKLAA